MLPRGGVACLLERKPNLTEPVEKKKKAFCFLPLPFETELPVHINGHFALDHEARRNLWRDEIGGYRTDWNNALLQDVVSSCYLTLLDKVRDFLQLPSTRSSVPLSCKKSAVLEKVHEYEKLFPTGPFSECYWKTLLLSVYQQMDKKKLRLLPVVRNTPEGSIDQVTSTARAPTTQLIWLPPTGVKENKAFFNNLDVSGCFAQSQPTSHHESRERMEKRRIQHKMALEEILLETGFNLVALSLSVFQALQLSGVNVSCISPTSVMEFYKTFSTPSPLCSVGQIPICVEKSPFRTAERVILVLKYCKEAEHFLTNLSGIPLLLTHDNCLHAFDASNPKFLSCYQHILPGSRQIFVQEQVRRSIFSGAKCSEASVFMPFSVEAFATNLHNTLPEEYVNSDGCVKWYPNTATLPNGRWIFEVWNFLADVSEQILEDSKRCEESKTSCIRGLLAPLSNCSLLPVTETVRVGRTHDSPIQSTASDVEHLLVPLKLLSSVLDLSSSDATRTQLVDILRKLGLPELNFVVIAHKSRQLACRLMASLKSPESLISSLKQKMKSKPYSLEGKLMPSECIIILQYFSNNVPCLRDVDKSTLRNLPFYLATHGNLVTLHNRRVCVLPTRTPRKELNVLEDQLDLVFLEPWGSLSELFKFLSLECVSSVKMYCKFILKHFKIFSSEARLAHLEYIRDSLLARRSETAEDERARLLDCLRSVELVPAQDGTLKTASCFYDPKNVVFHTMLSEDAFPPQPFNSDDWLPFLKEIGLVYEVSPPHFMTFATEVAREGANQHSDKTYSKSKVLVAHLFKRPNVMNEGLLQTVRGIRFVATDPVNPKLRGLFPQYGARADGQTPYIAFDGAVPTTHPEIVWTTAHLLPKWADARQYRYHICEPPDYCSAILAQLGVVVEPTVDLVTRHCQNICFQCEKDNETEVSDAQCLTRMSVMESIYKYLQGKAKASSVVKQRLEMTPCILVEKGKRFVRPKQVVLELYESLQIIPFLYRVPLELGQFQELFQNLGCSKSVTTSHYAMVLEMLHDRVKENKLHPNEIDIAFKAVKGFFEFLPEESNQEFSFSILYILYLPAMSRSNSCLDGPPSLTLPKSTELIFDDAPHYRSRIQHFYQPFVVDLEMTKLRCNSSMNHKELMMLLSTDLRPKMLSDVVEETFAESGISSVTAVSAADSLKQQLSSPQFCRGIVRLIHHANCKNKTLKESVVASVGSRLQNIEIRGMEKIVTHLSYNGASIRGSEEEVPFFVQKVSVSGQEIWKLYVSAVADIEDALSATLATVIADACEGLLRDAVLHVPAMLHMHPSKIASYLDAMRIRPDNSYGAGDRDVFPEPGSFIPIEEHHLLNEDFEEFEPGEYVGYELEDPSLEMREGEPTFIYAIVIEEVTTEEHASIFTKKYKINIGHDREPIVVKATDLYKFHRLQAIASYGLALSDQQGDYTEAVERQKIFDEVSDALEAAWKLPEDMRRKIIRRLYLRWHPDKNSGKEEFCRAVCQHIQSEIARLERGESRGFYDGLFGVWGTRASRHHSHRQRYSNNFNRHYGPWRSGYSSWGYYVPPSFCTTNPQPREAKRWFRQAEADLAAAENDIVTVKPSYEWACLKCQQAAEKALKAAQYARDAFKTNVHNLVQNSVLLEDSQLTSVARQLDCRVGESTRMRYPDRMCYPQIPHDVYSVEMAREATELAGQILDRVRDMVT